MIAIWIRKRSHLAEETGGRPILNTANVEALDRVIVDTVSYYWLGFYASRQGDDARHDIRVEVNRPGVQVRARKGFVDLSPAVERDLAVESALLLGSEGVGEPLALEVGEPKRKRVAVLLHDPATLRTLAGRVDVTPR